MIAAHLRSGVYRLSPSGLHVVINITQVARTRRIFPEKEACLNLSMRCLSHLVIVVIRRPRAKYSALRMREHAFIDA